MTEQVKNKHQSVTAVIPVYNRKDDLRRLLSSFDLIDFNGDLSIIVIDDASTEDYTSIFDTFRKNAPHIPLTVIRNAENSGPAHSRNAALATIKDGFVWFLDSDTEIFQPDMLDKALAMLERPRIGLVGEEAFFMGDRLMTHISKWYPNKLFNARFVPFDKSRAGQRVAIASANFIVPRALITEVGGFNPWMKMFEDVDLCMRLTEHGYELHSAPEIAVYHHASPKGRDGAFAFYRDMRQYTKKFHRERAKLVCLHNRHLLPFLPVLDLFYGIQIYLDHATRKDNASAVLSQKKNESLGLGTIAMHHALSMLQSYVVALKLFITGPSNA